MPFASVRADVPTCRIEWWHGYVTSRFFVLTDAGQLLESKPFWCRQSGPPLETTRARAAYDELVARLEAEGWTVFEDGGPWFATIFVHTALRPAPAAGLPQSERADGPVGIAPLPLPRPEEETRLAERAVDVEPATKTRVEPAAESGIEPKREVEVESGPNEPQVGSDGKMEAEVAVETEADQKVEADPLANRARPHALYASASERTNDVESRQQP